MIHPSSPMWKVAVTFPRDFYIPEEVKHQRPMVPEGTDLAIWTWESNGVPYGIAFMGKQSKPVWNYRFRNEQQRQKTIDDLVEGRRKSLEFKQKRQEERRTFQHGYVVGDILYSSWGYDQTNVDFYEVTDVRGKEIVIREIAKKVTEGSQGADSVVPIPGKYTDAPMRKRPGTGGSVSLSSFQSATKWDGRPKRQTSFGWGH